MARTPIVPQDVRVHRHAPHDWHSGAYVDDWIRHDLERNDERRPRLQRMAALAPFPPDAAISVLDVGAGSGVVTSHWGLPNARVTPGFFRRDARSCPQVRAWPARSVMRFAVPTVMDRSVGGPFDSRYRPSPSRPATSRSSANATAGYSGPSRAAASSTTTDLKGGLAAHEKLLRAAGFSHVERAWEQSPVAILAAYGKSTA